MSFVCELCEKTFAHRIGLKEHLALHTGSLPFECAKCGFKSRSDRLHKQHLATHTKIKCVLCPKMLSKMQLPKHMTESHSDANVSAFECDVCKEKLSTYALLEEHIKLIHSSMKPFECDICNKTFRAFSVFKEHKAAAAQYFQCQICDVELATACDFRVHKQMHATKREFKFKCEICNKNLHSRPKLKEHMQTHTKTEKNAFICEICQQRFTSLIHLRMHKKLHTSFECEMCHKHLATNSALQEHLATHLANQPKIVCNVCQQRFDNKVSLINHLLTHAGETRYVCGKCNKEFWKMKNVDEVVCDICKMKNKLKNILKCPPIKQEFKTPDQIEFISTNIKVEPQDIKIEPAD